MKITLIPGDGIGPDVSEAMKRCVDATGADIEWIMAEAGEEANKKHGTPIPESTLEAIRETKISIKGPITTPIGTGYRSINVALRQIFDLYANVRPAKIYPGVKTRFENVDLLVIRENTEGLYVGIEFEEGKDATKDLIQQFSKLSGKTIRVDSGISIKPISKTGSKRIVKFAFEEAKKRKKKHVTAVHKANIMKFTDGLFLREAEKVAKNYPKIQYDNRMVDNMCMQLVQKPELYDTLVMPNLYGDILSDLCAGLVGGLGVTPSANIGKDYAIFEAIHGSAPKYKGMNKVNPTAMILSGVMMLRYIGMEKEGKLLEEATASVIKEGKNVTYDLKKKGKPVGTSEMADAIIKKMKK